VPAVNWPGRVLPSDRSRSGSVEALVKGDQPIDDPLNGDTLALRRSIPAVCADFGLLAMISSDGFAILVSTKASRPILEVHMNLPRDLAY
jgi:hypothetical protein